MLDMIKLIKHVMMLRACSEAKVRRVVVVSSVGAVVMNPNFAKDQLIDEDCWSEMEYCRQNEHTANTSSLGFISVLKDGYEEMEDNMMRIVDVRDVAEAIKLVYEKHEAKGRFICMAHMITTQEMLQFLKEIYPNYNYPQSFKDGKDLLKWRDLVGNTGH